MMRHYFRISSHTMTGWFSATDRTLPYATPSPPSLNISLLSFAGTIKCSEGARNDRGNAGEHP